MSIAPEWNTWRDTSQSASGNAVTGHVCNCIGCCHRCGTCRTNPIHSRLYCERLQAWKAQRPKP